MIKRFNAQRITTCTNRLLAMWREHGNSLDGMSTALAEKWNGRGEVNEAAIFQMLGIARGEELALAVQILEDIQSHKRVDLSAIATVAVQFDAHNNCQVAVIAMRTELSS